MCLGRVWGAVNHLAMLCRGSLDITGSESKLVSAWKPPLFGFSGHFPSLSIRLYSRLPPFLLIFDPHVFLVFVGFLSLLSLSVY